MVEELPEEITNVSMVESLVVEKKIEFSYVALDFKIQEDLERFFFIVNIPKYERKGVSQLIWDKKVLYNLFG